MKAPQPANPNTMPELTNTAATEPFILFELAGTTYALRASAIQQMEMVENVTPVPNAAPFVEGVVYSRGQVIPAINLRVRLGFPRVDFGIQTRLVVVRHEGRTVGLIVDSSRDFLSIPAGAILPPPEAVTGLSGQYLEGIARIGERTVLALDLGQLLATVETNFRAPSARDHTAAALAAA